MLPARSFFGCPTTGDQGFSHQGFSARERLLRNLGNLPNSGSLRNRATARPQIARAETSETWARQRKLRELREWAATSAPRSAKSTSKWWVRWRVPNNACQNKRLCPAFFGRKPSYAKASEGTLLRAGAPCAARQREAGWRRGWDSNPRYACTHNGFRDRPDRPLWHLSGAPLIGGRFCRGNSAVGGADIPLFSPESGVSGVDLGGFLRIFRPPPAGHSGPPCSFVLSGIWGSGPASSLGMVGSAQPEGF